MRHTRAAHPVPERPTARGGPPVPVPVAPPPGPPRPCPNGALLSRHTPARAACPCVSAQVSTLANSNLALSKSGDMYSWGFGEMGQLANGKGGDETCPTLVESIKDDQAVLDIAAGAQHSVYVVMPRPN